MTRLLDASLAPETAQELISNLEYEGFSAEEMIPACVHAIIMLAFKHPATEQLLDEAANMLADNGGDQ